jgi:hypothetical protein
MGIKEDIQEKLIEIEILNDDLKKLRNIEIDKEKEFLSNFIGKILYSESNNSEDNGAFFFKPKRIYVSVFDKCKLLGDSLMFYNDGSFGQWEEEEHDIDDIDDYVEITPEQFEKIFTIQMDLYKFNVINNFPVFGNIDNNNQ